MRISEFVEQVICAGRREHQSRKTWQCYAGWTRRYGQWLQGMLHLHDADAETKVSGYLAHLATRAGGCSPVTQQFLFPGRQPSRDPETGIVRRHHLHEDTLAKALKRAAGLARIGKRITVHTLRHSFATAYLENGGSIHKLKELLGHAHLETTEIYTHCITQFASDICSPLDARPANVLPFVTADPEPAGRRCPALAR